MLPETQRTRMQTCFTSRVWGQSSWSCRRRLICSRGWTPRAWSACSGDTDAHWENAFRQLQGVKESSYMRRSNSKLAQLLFINFTKTFYLKKCVIASHISLTNFSKNLESIYFFWSNMRIEPVLKLISTYTQASL